MVRGGTSIYWQKLREHDRIFYQPLVHSTIKTNHPGIYLEEEVASIWKIEGIRESDVDRWERTYSCLLGHALLRHHPLKQSADSEGFLDPNPEPIQPFNNNPICARDSPIQSPGACVDDFAAIALPQLAPPPPLNELDQPLWFTQADLLSPPVVDYIPDQWDQSLMENLSKKAPPSIQEAISAEQPSSVSFFQASGQADRPPERSPPAPGPGKAQPAQPCRPDHGSDFAQVTATEKKQRRKRVSRMPKPSCIMDPFAEVETPESMRKTKFPKSAHYVPGPSRGRNNFRKRNDIATSTLQSKPCVVDIQSEASVLMSAIWVAVNTKPPPVLANQPGRNLGPPSRLTPTRSPTLDAEPSPDQANQGARDTRSLSGPTNQSDRDTESLPDLANQYGHDTESMPSVTRESSCSSITIPEDHEPMPKPPVPCFGLFGRSTDQISVVIPEDRTQKPLSSVPRIGLSTVCSYPSVQIIPDDHVRNPYPSVPLLRPTNSADQSHYTIPQDPGQNPALSFPRLGPFTTCSYPCPTKTLPAHMLESAVSVPNMRLSTICSSQRPDTIPADGPGRDTEFMPSTSLQESPYSSISTPGDHTQESISSASCSKLSTTYSGRSANHNSQPLVVAGSLPPTLPPSVEEAYKKKCIELKRRLQEVEETNDTFRLRKVRLMRGIRKMRLERAFLLETLGKRMKKNGSGINGMPGFYDEDSEGSSEGPPTVCKISS